MEEKIEERDRADLRWGAKKEPSQQMRQRLPYLSISLSIISATMSLSPCRFLPLSVTKGEREREVSVLVAARWVWMVESSKLQAAGKGRRLLPPLLLLHIELASGSSSVVCLWDCGAVSGPQLVWTVPVAVAVVQINTDRLVVSPQLVAEKTHAHTLSSY